MKRIVYFPLFFLLCFSNDILAQKKTGIIWDNYSVPHLDARNGSEKYYVFEKL